MAGAGGGEPPKKKKRPLLQPVVRPRLAAVATLEDAGAALRSARNIMVLVGAGISVSCGVPDFRSEGGLYALARRLGLALRDPQDLFDIRCFDDDPADFYKFAHALWPRKSVIPSLTHHFLAALDRAGRLLRVYTQNIDGLEKKANIPRAKIVECHGTLLTAHCRGGSAAPGRSSSSSCRAVCAAADLTEDVVAHRVPQVYHHRRREKAGPRTPQPPRKLVLSRAKRTECGQGNAKPGKARIASARQIQRGLLQGGPAPNHD